jgi:adenylate cyclase
MPNQQKVTRKLRAILSADVKGYSILMADDEAFTIKMIKEYRSIMSHCIEQHNGRVVDSPGDNLLAEFASAVDAVQCAVEIQKLLKKENVRLVEKKRLELRIGVNIGDVVQDEGRIYGDGVNIAARIEGLADPAGICVSRSAYDQIKKKLGFGFEYMGEHPVKNISEPVRVYKVVMDSDSTKPLVKELLKLPDKPSIAVLPFDNMSGDPSQEYFSDGMTEQIISGLCKVSNLFVIARNSSFAYKDRSVSTKQIAKELGVKYILEGSVQRAGDRVRITAQLIDATTDFHMWSDTYDRDLSDIFALQDEITVKLIDVMQIQLTFGKQAQQWEGKVVNINAYDKLMRGMECFYHFNEKDNAQARKLFMDAINIDNNYDMPFVMVGFTHIVDLMFGWSEDPITSFGQIEQYVGKALEKSDSLDVAHSLLGWLYLYKGQYEDAKKEGERAIQINPNGAEVHAHLAFTLTYIGESKEAIRLLNRALRLNPVPPTYYYHFLGIAYRNDGQYEKAIAMCKEAVRLDPDAITPYPTLVSSYILLNQPKEAQKYVSEVLRIDPAYSLSYFINTLPFKDQSETGALIDSLRKAGLPE